MIVEKDDTVILSVSQEELEEEIANMELIEEQLVRNIQQNPRFDKHTKKRDIRELKHTFEVATTAMKMIWLNFKSEDVKIENGRLKGVDE